MAHPGCDDPPPRRRRGARTREGAADFFFQSPSLPLRARSLLLSQSLVPVPIRNNEEEKEKKRRIERELNSPPPLLSYFRLSVVLTDTLRAPGHSFTNITLPPDRRRRSSCSHSGSFTRLIISNPEAVRGHNLS